ncbi:hypothetical protein LNKW23_15660 [Paralimibaculum aggregatum]|uniref:Uncharacterized protein n=1 Tax=Paralimibaculum aggregatum TaxID=3036245 RepID=A0ABQ6LGA4_9RHOB|nr:hypothetical protein [Limibaculum sp. NKW23]GMG82353.1 hypothetical protein LNKW23_15660 [Limibaculum sp. NKW23]
MTRWLPAPAACALALAATATAATAQVPDVTGNWACSVEEYESGDAGQVPDLFNLALYRTGAFALTGRDPEGRVYQGNGTWHFGRNAANGTTVTLKGNRLEEGIAVPFELAGDLVGADEFGRITKHYTRTRAFECLRQQ